MAQKFTTIEGGVRPALVAHPELRVFWAQERSNRTRTYFLASDAKTFSDTVRDAPKRNFHEHTLPDRPIKLYFDLDDKEPIQKDWELLVARVCELVRTNLARQDAVVRRWDADRPGEKKSAHLIFPDVWFESPASLCAFVQIIKRQLDSDERIDTQIYSDKPSVFKSIRAPYCCSYDRNNPLLPHGEDGRVDFDERKFLESLVTQGQPPLDRLLSFTPDQQFLRPGAADRVPETDPARVQALARVEAWVRKFWAVKTIYVKEELDGRSGKWMWHAVPSLWCPRIQRRHLNNTTLVRGTMYGTEHVRIETFCLDKECGEQGWIENNDFEWDKIAFPKSY